MFTTNFKPFVPRKHCAAVAASPDDPKKKSGTDAIPSETKLPEEPTKEDFQQDPEYDEEEEKCDEEYEEPPTSDQVCTFWLKGECLVVNCPFLHTNIGVLCKFYKSGNCILGDNCVYMHSSLEDQIERLYGDEFDPEYDEVYDFGFYDPEYGDSAAEELPTEDDFPPLGTDPKDYKVQKVKEANSEKCQEITDEEKKRSSMFKAYSGYSQDLCAEKAGVLRKWVAKLGEGSEFVAEVAAREGLPENEHLSLEYVKWVLSEHAMDSFDSIVARESEHGRNVDAVLHGKLSVMHFRQGVKAYLGKNIARSKEHTEKGLFHYARMLAAATCGEESALCDSFNYIEETHETVLNMARVPDVDEATKLFEGVFVTTKSPSIRYVFVVMPDRAFFDTLMSFVGCNHFKYANCTPDKTGEIVCVVCPPNRV